ncbi:hypothetical protein BgiMline_010238, partial [Biomphalaria glabrata]
ACSGHYREDSKNSIKRRCCSALLRLLFFFVFFIAPYSFNTYLEVENYNTDLAIALRERGTNDEDFSVELLLFLEMGLMNAIVIAALSYDALKGDNFQNALRNLRIGNELDENLQNLVILIKHETALPALTENILPAINDNDLPINTNEDESYSVYFLPIATEEYDK